MYRKLSCGSVKNLLKPLGDSTATDEPEGFFVMKKCNKCGEVKPFEKFYKNKAVKNGINSYCKTCNSEMCKNRRRSLYGKAEHIYVRQKSSSKLRGHQPPAYTRGEFIDWMISNEDYLKLHDKWVESGYKKSLAPSCDRLDDYKGYSFDNIRVVTWEQNRKKGYLDRVNGKNNKLSRAVIKCDLNGLFLEEYYSIHQAARDTGVSSGNIWKACTGRYTKSGGFCWKYADV